MNRLKSLAFVMLTCLIFTASSYANPISDLDGAKVRQDIKINLVRKYPNKYTLIELLYTQNVQAFNNLTAVSLDKVSDAILTRLIRDYYPSFVLIKTLYNHEIEAFRRIEEME